jgi:prepilin-type processing-associated H-X9-DG protein
MRILVALFAIVGVGAALLPPLGKCGCVSTRVQCGTNEHQILTAVFEYAQKHNGAAPPSFDILRDGALSSTAAAKVFHCPEGKGDYVHVGFGLHVPGASKATVLLYEPPSNHKDSKTGKGAMNIGYADGSVRVVLQPQADKIIAELKAGHNPPREEMIQ